MMHGRVRSFMQTLLASVMAACGGDSTAPPTIASVTVTSPLGVVWDVGTAVQLVAVAQDVRGNTASGVTYTWTSSDPDVVSVDGMGRVQSVRAGSSTIRAVAGAVTGSLQVQVVEADVAAITTLTGDAYMAALVAGTTSAVRARLQTALANCTAGASAGNLETVQQCLAAIRAEASSATDATDRVALAVLGLFVDQLERLLNT